ncbi:MAG: choice-of-anchor B family protein [Saprospiraceae bacterium]|nr:choice-of-anchor B family protein [Saprospiraceae bacterium]
MKDAFLFCTNRNYFLIVGCYCLFTVACIAQNRLSIDSLSQVPIKEKTSSVWGLTHSSGAELALLGTRTGLRIYNIERPENPVEIEFIEGNACNWREIKTYKNFIYLVTECEDGLLIVDCNELNNIRYLYRKELINHLGDTVAVKSSHTLFIDERGFLFLSGSPYGYGFVCFDLNPDPLNPKYISHYSDEYFHEVFVLRDTLYGASLYNGEFVVMDLHNPRNPVFLARHTTGYRFTHSVWRETERSILYTTDERSGAFVESWDISDLNRIRLLDKYRPNYPDDQYSIPHNCFIKGSILFISWYTEGVRIINVSRPKNMVEVGYFDTHPQANVEFHGVWNVYPFFNSGSIIASDIENGLFVFRFNDPSAGYLEGSITDEINGSPVQDSKVRIKGKQINTFEASDLEGKFQTGAIANSLVHIEISKAGYYTLNDTVFFTAKETILRNYKLKPLPSYPIKVIATNLISSDPESNVIVKIWNNDYSYTLKTDSKGEADFNQLVEGTYHIQSSKWGKLHFSVDTFIVDGLIHRIDMSLIDGYEDQFNIPQQWHFIPDSQKLKWRFGNFSELLPKPSNYPSMDIESDIGNGALYTDNFDDLEQNINVVGHSYLISPEMDLSSYDVINLKYFAWAYGGWENSIKEAYLIFNDDLLPLENLLEDLSGHWNPESEFTLNVMNKERTKCYFVIHLFNDPDYIHEAINIKAALDGFKLTGMRLNSVSSSLDVRLQLFPNPFLQNIFVENNSSETLEVELFDQLGFSLKRFSMSSMRKMQISTHELKGNIFIAKVYKSSGDLVAVKKLMKL